MKKYLKVVIFTICLIFISIKIYKLSIKNYDISYQSNNYQIREIYKQNNTATYHIIINNKKNNYIYTINNSFNKNKKIIKIIKTYKKNNLTCIVPIYKKSIKMNIYCNLDKQQISTDYLIKTKNKDFKKIQKKVKVYHIEFSTTSDIKKSYKKIQIYQNNILPNDIYYYWNYKGIYILTKNKLIYKKVLKKDLYDNIQATTINNYYILLENTSVNGIKNIYYYNFKKAKLKKYSPKEILSKEVYINGVVDNIIYLTDKKEKKQYKLNIKKEKIERVDQDETNYIVYQNGKKKSLSKSDFFMTEQYFINNEIEDKKITKSNDLKIMGDYYYFTEQNNLYKVLKYNKKHKILLLKLDNVKEWYIQDDKIVLLREDTVYIYQDKVGLRKIFKSNELKYNYKNIYKIGKK